MSGTTLAPVFQIGPRVTAQVLGLPFAQYRPTGPTNPVTTPFGAISAWITGDPKLMATAPFKYAKPVGYAAVDPVLTKAGDYLIGPLVPGGPSETFFIASQDVPEPIQVVICNRVLEFTRPNPVSGSGYSGRQNATDTVIATGWPASVLQGTKGEANPTGIPSDVRAPWLAILLPAIPGVTLQYSDLAIDDLGRRMVLSNVELTNLGYRISATYAGA